MTVLPCPLCGYDAPQARCPHCASSRFASELPERRRGLGAELRAGFAALPRGFGLLFSIRGTKRWLVPPALLTMLLFALGFAWAWSWLEDAIEAARLATIEGLSTDPESLLSRLASLIEAAFVGILAKLSGLLLFLVAAFLVSLWFFSVVYEAVLGPFLDLVHARVETVWFGSDPESAHIGPEGTRWARWRWRLGAIARSTWTSLVASLIALVILLLFLWVKFLPVIGWAAFALIAGFATAVSLLDIPFSRRRWSLAQRLGFVFAHLPAVAVFGTLTGVVYLLPFLGPLVGAPAASLGGLWLVTWLDKGRMRPPASAKGAA